MVKFGPASAKASESHPIPTGAAGKGSDGHTRVIPDIFKGKRDTTTKESIKLDELESVKMCADRNPSWMPVSKTGNPISRAKLGAAKGGKTYEELVLDKYMERRILKIPLVRKNYEKLIKEGPDVDRVPGQKVVHDTKRIEQARGYISGRSYGSSGLKTRLEYSEETHAASLAGPCFINSERFYLHSDGTLCRPCRVTGGCMCFSINQNL